MTLCETTVQHFLLLAPLYSHRKGLSVCHNHTSVCLKTSTAPLETLSLDSCKQPAFCWVQFLQNGKSEARSLTPWLSSIRLPEGRWTVSFPCPGTFAGTGCVSVLLVDETRLMNFILGHLNNKILLFIALYAFQTPNSWQDLQSRIFLTTS